MKQSLWNIVVLGGGHDKLAQAHGVATKALIPLHGKPIAAYVLDALLESQKVGELVYVGATNPQLHGIDKIVPDAGSFINNLRSGIQTLSHRSKRVLIVTADIPLINAHQIKNLLEEIENSSDSAGLLYPIITKESCESVYPEVKRTYAKIKDGRFTGGNVIVVDSHIIDTFLPTIEQVFQLRKSPLKLAGIIGLGTAFKLMTGQITLKELEDKVSHILGVEARAIITPHAAIGTDIDKEEDIMLAKKVLSPQL